MDYSFLKAKGIELIQELSGDLWTDYNEHDPGITILEQLCYAISDLTYRANYDIKDILESDPDHGRDSVLYSAAESLPSNPVTIEDYMKLIIDHVKEEVRNIWIEPLRRFSQKGAINGLYHVKVWLQDSVYMMDTEARDKAYKDVKANVWKFLDQNRLLCEDFEDIVILKPQMLNLKASIRLDQGADAEDVLAKVFFEIDRAVSPLVRFYSLPELKRRNVPDYLIFNGPLLQNGFIDDSDLTQNPNFISNAGVISAIKKIDGVNTIHSLKLQDVNPGAYEAFNIKWDGVFIELHKVPMLNQRRHGGAQGILAFASEVTVFKDNIPYEPNFTIIARKLDLLRKDNLISHYPEKKAVKDFQVKKGKSKEIGEYYSIQNDFPAFYGIGARGIPVEQLQGNVVQAADDSAQRRVVQAKQLKGYLLFFEQIMANFLAQLSQVNKLFSISEALNGSYFTQSIKTAIPQWELTNLFKSIYEDELPKYIENEGEFLERRNKFLDHLLARFGEDPLKYELPQINLFLEGPELKRQAIKNKINFLKHFTSLSKNGRGFDYTRNILEAGNMSGLEHKMRAILDIAMNKALLWESSRKLQIFFNDRSPYENIRLTGDFSPIMDIAPTEEDKKDLEDENIHEELLEAGYGLHNFRIGPSMGREYHDSEDVTVVFKSQNEKGEQWKKIPRSFANRIDAHRYVNALAQWLRYVNKQIEGFYVVEHILFRPERPTFKFNLHYHDEKYKVDIKTLNQFPYEELQDVFNEVINTLKKNDYAIEEVPESTQAEYRALLNDKQAIVQFSIPQNSADSNLTPRKYLQRYCKTQLNPSDIYGNKMEFMTDNVEEFGVDAADYSFKMTVVLPSWPSRFRNRTFIKYLESLVRSHTPAHIVVYFKFMDFNNMKQFETTYINWQKERSVPGHQRDIQAVNRLAKEVMTMITSND